jgi:uncharacterized SAM-binding protein YcdF (DUF218 family)
MKNTPGWVIAVCMTLLVALFGTFAFWLSLKGVDDTQFRGILILFGTLITSVFSAGGFIASTASQKQTNGNLTETIRTAVSDAVKENSNGRP